MSIGLQAMHVLRFWHTIRHLRLVQIANRIWRSLPPRPDLRPPPSRRPVDIIPRFLPRPVSIFGAGRFEFLNQERQLTFPAGWLDDRASKLWRYNLHYFDGLLSATTREDVKRAVVKQWVEDNEPGHGDGWEPYPISLRTVNWIKWELQNGGLDKPSLQRLATQVRLLSKSLEFHLLGNHLFANAKALVFAGYFFQGAEADAWRARGLAILKREVSEQFLADGGHFERSPTYHATAIEDLLDLIMLGRAFDDPMPDEFVTVSSDALRWLSVLTRPDGLPPLFNDAAYGVSPTLADLSRYACLAGIEPQRPPTCSVDLPDTGYARLEGEDFVVFVDAGSIGPDYLPGHAHADTFGFELYAHGQPVVVDTGTSTYDIGPRRRYERSTAAHNTVEVSGRSQSDMWAGFRVGRRARISDRSSTCTALAGSHDGYASLGILHRREFALSDGGLRIKDWLTGRGAGRHEGIARLHFHPAIQVRLEADTLISNAGGWTFDGAKAISVREYSYAPEFNRLEPSTVVEVCFEQHLVTAYQP